MTDAQWWRDAVIYQIYPRSFGDASGDGTGDLRGVTSRLGHLADLGVDAIWLSPFYPSPQHDGGYDVADYCDVDPRYGTLDDLDTLLDEAHRLGLRVIVDLVPNHTSSTHRWFAAALEAPPGSTARARYVFRDGRAGGAEPPNNWRSRFGGPAWTRVTEPDGRPGQWYLHLFDTSQPDLDWTNPQVHDDIHDVLKFWLDRGVDGFRVDVAHGLVKADGLPDADLSLGPHHSPTSDLPMWDQPGVHEVYRSWRRLLDDYPGDRALVAEAWVEPSAALARYVRPDEMHQSFNFPFLMTPWDAAALRGSIDESLSQNASVGAPTTWVLSNHDVVRHASRLGLARATEVVETDGIGPDDPQPDAELGLRRARAATTLMLALPGSAYLYQGEELGLPDATRLPDEVLQDPRWERSGHTDRGRDGCRVPIPWEVGAPSLGFGPTVASWLPQPVEYGSLARDRQRDDPGSTLELYRSLLRLRRKRRLGTAELRWDDHGPGVLAVTLSGSDVVTRVIANLGPRPVPLAADDDVLVSSASLPGREIPQDVTVWLQVRS